jgi:hypothetical protein
MCKIRIDKKKCRSTTVVKLNARMTVAKAVRPMPFFIYADSLQVASGENYVLANIAESAAYKAV